VPPQPVPITAQLAFLVPPDTVPAGARFLEPIQVVLRDFGGATITTATAAVSLSIASGPGGGALGGARTVNTVNGVATFTDLTVTPVGTYTLQAAASGATTASSGSFDVGALSAADGLGHLDAGAMNFARSQAHDAAYADAFAGNKAVTVDPTAHRAWVADSANRRILMFALSTTNDLAGQDLVADLVLGAFDFKASGPFVNGTESATRGRLSVPHAVACDPAGQRLFVADTFHNRVLVYDTSILANGMEPVGVLGQVDFVSNVAGTSLSGMALPSALALDAAGSRLFVADGGNDRVLVFDVQVIQDGEAAANVIGATGSGTVSATTLETPTGVAVDPSGDRLFVSDLLSHRVLFFDISGGITDGMPASAALGQTDLVTGDAPTSTSAATVGRPAGLWHDDANQLFVVDALFSRVLIFDTTVVASGEAAVHVLGQPTSFDDLPEASRSGMDSPEDCSGADGRLFVTDTGNHRLLIFDITTIVDGEDALDGLGHAETGAMDFSRRSPDDGPFDDTFSYPSDVLVDPAGHRLYVADRFNHRVLVFDLSVANDFVGTDRVADVVLGPSTFRSGPTFLFDPAGLCEPRGLALAGDRLFVADSLNHRVVVFDTTALVNGMGAASNVLGQPDLAAQEAGLDATHLAYPVGLAVDVASGHLFVADQGRNRVLVFDVSTIADGEPAIGVLGQPGFTTDAPATTQAGMFAPNGLELDAVGGRLFVTDRGNCRTLVFDVATLVDGEDAIAVLGQPGFTTSTFGSGSNRMGAATGVAFDPGRQRLYVVDNDNARCLIFDLTALTSGQAAIGVLGRPVLPAGEPFPPVTFNPHASGPDGLAYPEGIELDPTTGRVYVADAGNNRVLRFDLP
jgi:DNA-binding beta-propeller fold protein YncE